MAANLSEALVASLRADIVDGRITPGEKLPSESELIEAHGVSRTVVREAVARLKAEGLVHTRRGAGSYALTPPPDAGGDWHQPRSLEERRQLLRYRIGLESETAALAAERRRASGDELIAHRLDEALAAFAAAGTQHGDAARADHDFHLRIAESSGNRYLLEALRRPGPAIIAMPPGRLAETTPESSRRLETVAAEHRAIREAIVAGDALGAAAAMRVHLGNSEHRLLLDS